jgi:hypothetical protein
VKLTCADFGSHYGKGCCSSCHEDYDYYGHMCEPEYPGKRKDIEASVCCSVYNFDLDINSRRGSWAAAIRLARGKK